MHYLYFVAVPNSYIKNNEATLLEVQFRVEQTLIENNFNNQEGFWSGGVCDWFVIGGRWNGILSPAYPQWSNALDQIKKNKSIDLQKVWEDNGGTGDNPDKEDTYDHKPREHNCQPLTQAMFDRLPKQNYFKEFTEVCVLDEDLNIEEVHYLKDQENLIDNYHLVVIDYHN